MAYFIDEVGKRGLKADGNQFFAWDFDARKFSSPAKGRCSVSCSKSFCKEEFGRFVAWAAANLPEGDFERLPSWGDATPSAQDKVLTAELTRRGSALGVEVLDHLVVTGKMG